MKNVRLHALLLLVGLMCLSSCADKTICPAFQSYYVLDEDKKKEMFAYFGEDSIPKVQDAHVRKGHHGIIEQASYFGILPGKLPKNDYKERTARMNSLRMEVIYPSDEEDEELDLSAELPESQATNEYESGLNLELPEYTDLTDTTQQEGTQSDSIRYHYNVDQMTYMKMFGDDLIMGKEALKDSIASNEKKNSKNKSGGDQAAPKKKGFFKKIFGGGKKKKGDSIADMEGSNTTDVGAGEELSKADKKKKKAEEKARKKAEKQAAKKAASDAKDEEETSPGEDG
jgi:hypothetical protein